MSAFTQSAKRYLIAAILIILLIPVWIYFGAPAFKKLPNDFYYSADILSLDNLYDETDKQYLGAHISKTKFSYETIGQYKNLSVIRNRFVVGTLSDKPIITITRDYYVDPYDWKHVPVKRKANRGGYLFGPRYLNKKPFVYWHINYDTPTMMEFVDVEKVYGLTVYHFKSNLASDQTSYLTYLPGVPKERGVTTNGVLQLWLEPVSGWLVKYQDNSVAYLYDQKTQKIIMPWNQFSNRYTEISITNQVQNARALKYKILFVDFGVPILLLLAAGFILIISYLKYHQKTIFHKSYLSFLGNAGIAIIIVLLLISIIFIPYYYFGLFTFTRKIYTVGISQWDNDPEKLEIIQGFKNGLQENGFIEGQNIQYIIKNPSRSIENQINIIQSFLQEDVDLIFTLTTTGTLIAKGITTETPIIFADVFYPRKSGLVENISVSKNNLVGSRSYVSPAIQFNRFEKIYPNTKQIAFVYHKGDPDSEMQYQEYKVMMELRNIPVIDVAAIDTNDLMRKLNTIPKDSVIYVACDTFMQGGGGSDIVVRFTQSNKIPNFTCDRDSVKRGLLVASYIDPFYMGKLAGIKAGLILNGADPRWLHSEASETAFTIINRAVANQMGLSIPARFETKRNTTILEQ